MDQNQPRGARLRQAVASVGNVVSGVTEGADRLSRQLRWSVTVFAVVLSGIFFALLALLLVLRHSPGERNNLFTQPWLVLVAALCVGLFVYMMLG